MISLGNRSRDSRRSSRSIWLTAIANPAARSLIFIVLLAFNMPALGQDRLRSEAPKQRVVVMSRGQWKVPLETVHCLSLASTKKIKILDKDYSGAPEVKALIGRSFNDLSVHLDDPQCKYVYVIAVPTHDRAVRLRGQPAVILASVGVCEWESPSTINPNRCSQKNVWFFQKNIPPLELIATAFMAFTEPQDRHWAMFQPGSVPQPCTAANTKSVFFKADKAPADEPLVIAATIVDLIRPEDWSRAKAAATPIANSLYAVTRVDKILKGTVSYSATTIYLNASVGRCVQPVKVGDSGILVGSANEIGGGIVRFFPRLNSE
jgi:hypothetical protein